jgi:hypothetical protein
MKDYEIWLMITRHLAKDETEEEHNVFLIWLHANTNNRTYFEKVKALWDSEPIDENAIVYPKSKPFRERFTIAGTIDFITKHTIGNFIGISVGVWVASTFTHKVTERKSLHNLFGLMHRKTTIVNEIPHWQQTVIAIIVGYIALELVHYFLQSQRLLYVWKHIRKWYLTYSTSNNYNR